MVNTGKVSPCTYAPQSVSLHLHGDQATTTELTRSRTRMPAPLIAFQFGATRHRVPRCGVTGSLRKE